MSLCVSLVKAEPLSLLSPQPRYITFNAAEGQYTPKSPEQMLADAQALVSGWDFSLKELLAMTPPESVTLSRVADRWNPGPWGRGLGEYIYL